MSASTDIGQALETLQRRVEALEEENARLRHPAPVRPAPPAGSSRRQVLLGGAGILGAVMGGQLLGRAEPSYAAAIATEPNVAQRYLGLRTTVTPLRSRGALWATHEWDLGEHFAGAQPPVVVATAWDDQLEHDMASFCVCAVQVHGTPGAYRAVIMVRNISPFATEVVVNALALGD